MSPTKPTTHAGKVAGSYRDPSGYVFWRDGRVFRAIDDACFEVLRGLADDGLLPQLIDEQVLVGTSFVEGAELVAELRAEHPAHEHFLEHAALSTITYPYEWSISMLADAAVHTLDLQMRLLASGCSLKDATAYNIQFVGGRPVFIDLSSIERPKRLDLWFALGQFAQMFLYPLMLCRHHGWDLRSYFLASIGGRQIEQVARSVGWLERLRPRVFLDLTLPLWLHRWAEKGSRARREMLEKPRTNPNAQILNLKRLRRKVAKLASGYRPSGVWSEYKRICNYVDAAEEAKKSLVREFLESTRPARVLDLGCNTGDYSRLAADCGAEVLAVDSDHDAVEVLYRQLRESAAPITPMVIDLANPSPGIGYLNRERPPFLERTDAECVLALALIHHLLVSANLSLAAIRDLFWELASRDVVLEFVPTDDSMFQRLLKFRVDLFGDLTLDLCRRVFLERFELLRETAIAETKRTLLFLRKRAAGA